MSYNNSFNIKNTYEIKQFGETLKPAGKTITITNEFDPKTFVLEDVVFTKNENVVLVGKYYPHSFTLYGV